jgi:hypothetical protein
MSTLQKLILRSNDDNELLKALEGSAKKFSTPEMNGETFGQMYARLAQAQGGQPMMPAYAYKAKERENQGLSDQEKIIRLFEQSKSLNKLGGGLSEEEMLKIALGERLSPSAELAALMGRGNR